MDDSLVSIIIPTFNRADLLPRAVNSALTQTYKNIEVIIIDDGSLDNTKEVVDQFDDQRIVYLRHEMNLGFRAKGGQAARNTGIKEAKGEYVTFLDSDDEYLPQKVEKQIDAISQTKSGLVHCGCFIVERGKKEVIDLQVPKLKGEVLSEILRGPCPPFPGMLVKRELLLRIGLLDEAILAYQEWDTYIQLAEITTFEFVDEPLYVVHSWRPDISKEWVKGAQGYYQILKKHRKKYVMHVGSSCFADHLKHASLWAYAKGKGDMFLTRRILFKAYLVKPWDLKPLGHIFLLLFGFKFYQLIYNKVSILRYG